MKDFEYLNKIIQIDKIDFFHIPNLVLYNKSVIMSKTWEPKNKNNDMYIGKLAKIYVNDESKPKEGKLIYIKECVNRPNCYSVCIEKTIGYPTRNTITEQLIDRVEVQMFEINDEVYKMCDLFMNNDVSNVINEYVTPYVEI